METLDRIMFDPQIMGGRAGVRRMRIPVSVIVYASILDLNCPRDGGIFIGQGPGAVAVRRTYRKCQLTGQTCRACSPGHHVAAPTATCHTRHGKTDQCREWRHCPMTWDLERGSCTSSD